MNNVVLVGRLTKDPELEKVSNDSNVSNITIAVTRNYKNNEGIYETDFVKCRLWNAIANSTTEYCKKGDIVGIKGRLESETYEVNGEKRNVSVVVAEKITFLSSKKESEKKKEDNDLEF